MKVLASADVHGKWPVYKWLLAIVREHSVDAMILGGDLLGCPDEFATPEEAQRHEGRLLIELLDTAGVPVFYIMGNDDLVELEPQSGRVRSIHGRVAKLGSFSLLGINIRCPSWAVPSRSRRLRSEPTSPLSLNCRARTRFSFRTVRPLAFSTRDLERIESEVSRSVTSSNKTRFALTSTVTATRASDATAGIST